MYSVLMQPSRRPDRSNSDSLEELLGRVAGGDQDSLAKLFERTQRLVRARVLHFVRDQDLADDIVVQTYTKVWGLAARFDATKGSALTWLRTISSRIAIDNLRRQSTRLGEVSAEADQLEERVSPMPDPSESAAQAECSDELRQAVEDLPEKQRIVVEAAFYAGMSHSEIAEALGEALGTIKSRVRAGLLALRKALEPGEVELS